MRDGSPVYFTQKTVGKALHFENKDENVRLAILFISKFIMLEGGS
jgi:hypothetical protein